ncbi:division/cell wall cluster transcriptional repressor MraZ [Collinsella tanakaei]|uniref:division/cell wall cluster transcriptional repressor MraZ n=1 Tax=Collinsella tanakaei TaxID=626935 RepID=UPI00195DFD89|nr:division/cell wall cluster transcriptional repressor MraZ [Collinsella tanakaei]
MILTGSFERNLDAKGRLSLPAALRDDLPSRVRILPAPDVEAVYVFPEDRYEAWVMSLFEKQERGFDRRNLDDQKLMRVLNSMATPAEIDSANRIALPESYRSKKHLDREVTVIGNTDHLEIWDRETWNQTQAETEAELMDLFFS